MDTENSRKTEHACGYLLEPAMTFCPRCGKKVFEAPRSTNEIKAMINSLQLALTECTKVNDHTAMHGLMVIVPLITTLDWALGNSPMSPLDMVNKFIEQEKRGG